MNEWPKYRKRPVEIEACRLTPGNRESLAGWCSGRIVMAGSAWAGIQIPTLEGDHLARPGDWIIKGVAGEFYPCKPEIFEATYEPA